MPLLETHIDFSLSLLHRIRPASLAPALSGAPAHPASAGSHSPGFALSAAPRPCPPPSTHPFPRHRLLGPAQTEGGWKAAPPSRIPIWASEGEGTGGCGGGEGGGAGRGGGGGGGGGGGWEGAGWVGTDMI